VAQGTLQQAWSEGAFWRRAPASGEWVTLGLAAVLVGAALRTGVFRWWARPGFWLVWTSGAFLAVAALGLSQHVGVIHGTWHAWLEDDPMVSMQYAKHLVQGDGLVWTPGERVEGFSNPLWTLVMAGVMATGVPRALAALPMHLINLGLGVAAIFAVARLARSLGAAPLAAAFAAAGFGLSWEWTWAASSGMESVAFACACAALFAALADSRNRGEAPPAWVPVLAGWTALLRFDALLPVGLVLAWSWTLPSRRGRLWDAAVTLGPVLAWQFFRLSYYGAWVPNTVLLKAGYWPGRYTAGWQYVLRLDWEQRLAMILAVSALLFRRTRPWALVLALLLAYGVTTAGDFYPGTRYLAPAWPLIWALAAAASSAMFPRRGAWIVACAALFSYEALWDFPDLMKQGYAYGRDRVEIAEELGSKVAPGETVAAAWAGSFFYFSDVRGVDLLGKCDPIIARLPPDPTLGGTAHNKCDLDVSLGRRRPDWVLMIPPVQPGYEAWTHSILDARIWGDPRFAAHCRPRAIPVGGPWALCHCRWDSSDGSGL